MKGIRELLNSDRLSMYEKGFYKKILDGDANEVELTASLKNCPKCWQFTMGQLLSLSLMNMILLFRKDIQKIFMMSIIGFMRNFFSGAFKDNRNLSYGFLTGILRIAQGKYFSVD